MTAFGEFAENFERLRSRDAASDGSTALPAIALGEHRAAITPEGRPALYVNCSDRPSLPRNVRTTGMSVDFVGRCRLRVGGTDRTAEFVRAVCRSGEPDIERAFLIAAWAVVGALPAEPTYDQAVAVFKGMVDVFERLSATPRQKAQGLWAELFVIAEASDPVAMCAGWRRDPYEKFDFVLGATRLEVKSTTQEFREHRFSLGQLTIPAPARVVIASVMTREAAGGTTLGDLADRIRRVLAEDARARFESILIATAGRSYEDVMESAFDHDLARSTLAFYRGEDVPSPIVAPSDPVRDVRFASDLSRVAPMERSDVGLALAAW